ncbi:MAG: DNA replication/repair protein RecF [Calditrichaeota bacterium]|nr:MAG: DNA replication/repair protein RecF [Calditrichota bacterium]
MFYSRSEGKKAFFNDNKVKQFSEVVGQMPVVVLSLDDMEIMYGYSNERRKWLDILISLIDPLYLSALKKYKRTLIQKNKQLANDFPDKEEISAWNIQLAAYGAEIIKKRVDIANEINRELAEVYQNISGDHKQVEIKYLCKTETNLYDAEKIREALLIGYEKDFFNEKIRKLTLTGPHKDDVLFYKDNYPIKKFGSVGENKTFLIALKILEQRLIKRKTGKTPLLLLDDIFGELDNERVHNFLGLVENDGQTFITTTNFQRMNTIIEMDFHHFNVTEKGIAYAPTLH